MQKVITECTDSFDKYEYSKAKSSAEKFFWSTLCDNYLEICKERLYNPESRGENARKAAQFTLYNLFSTTLKLMAPIMPHITDSVYQLYFANKEKNTSIHMSKWPKAAPHLLNDQAEVAGDLVVDIIAEVRKFKSENQVSLKHQVKISIECDNEDKTRIESAIKDLEGTANSTEISFGHGNRQLEGREVKISIELVKDPATNS
ncbi:class I tRNA ligase family protein [Candidatus Woesearchaeota archaeon]|nr:class I tRNA ligase family protein [Candidatus Woesearchaeota archaeon]